MERKDIKVARQKARQVGFDQDINVNLFAIGSELRENFDI